MTNLIKKLIYKSFLSNKLDKIRPRILGGAIIEEKIIAVYDYSILNIHYNMLHRIFCIQLYLYIF